MNAEAVFRALTRDFEAVVLAVKNFTDVTQITNQKIDTIIEVIDRPEPEGQGNPLADALNTMADAIRELGEQQARMLDMQAEILKRLPPRAAH